MPPKKNPFSRTRWNIKEHTHACHIPIDLPRRAAISISFVVESELVSTWYSTPSKKKEKRKKKPIRNKHTNKIVNPVLISKSKDIDIYSNGITRSSRECEERRTIGLELTKLQ